MMVDGWNGADPGGNPRPDSKGPSLWIAQRCPRHAGQVTINGVVANEDRPRPVPVDHSLLGTTEDDPCETPVNWSDSNESCGLSGSFAPFWLNGGD